MPAHASRQPLQQSVLTFSTSRPLGRGTEQTKQQAPMRPSRRRAPVLMLDSNRGRASVQKLQFVTLFAIFVPCKSRERVAPTNAGRGEPFPSRNPGISPAPLPRGGSVSNNPCGRTERISDFLLYGLYSLYGLYKTGEPRNFTLVIALVLSPQARGSLVFVLTLKRARLFRGCCLRSRASALARARSL